MTTAVDELVVTFTEETHETECCEPDCSNVAVWHAVFSTYCGCCPMVVCQPHADGLRLVDEDCRRRSASGFAWMWCTYCRANVGHLVRLEPIG